MNHDDREVGVVASVEGDVAHVRPAADAVDSVKSSIGWEGVAEETQPLDTDAVREITDDVVRLEGDLPSIDRRDLESAVDANAGGDADGQRTDPAGGSAGTEETEIAEDLRDETGDETLEETDAIDEDGTAASDERGATASDDRERELNRGLEADPTELAREGRDPGTRTGASVEPTDDFESTDAAVDPGEQPRRSDPEIDPDAASDPAPADGDRGPTTEDARDADLEDGPEERQVTDEEEGEGRHPSSDRTQSDDEER